jgi:hypothetical protein
VPLTSDVILQEARRFQPYSERSVLSNETVKPVDWANCYKGAVERTAPRTIDIEGNRDVKKFSTSLLMRL